LDESAQINGGELATVEKAVNPGAYVLSMINAMSLNL